MSTVSRRALLGGFVALASAPAFAGGRRVQLRAGYVPGFEAAPLFVMLGEGWPAAAGIDIAPVRFATAAELADAVARGLVDSYWGPVSALAFSPAAARARIVAGTTVEDVAVLSSRQGFARLASDPARPMATQAVKHWLAASNRAVEIVPVAADAALDALAQGAVDAAALREPLASAALDRTKDLRLIARGAEIFPDRRVRAVERLRRRESGASPASGHARRARRAPARRRSGTRAAADLVRLGRRSGRRRHAEPSIAATSFPARSQAPGNRGRETGRRGARRPVRRLGVPPLERLK